MIGDCVIKNRLQVHISDNLINHFAIHDLLASIRCDLDFQGLTPFLKYFKYLYKSIWKYIYKGIWKYIYKSIRKNMTKVFVSPAMLPQSSLRDV